VQGKQAWPKTNTYCHSFGKERPHSLTSMMKYKAKVEDECIGLKC